MTITIVPTTMGIATVNITAIGVMVTITVGTMVTGAMTAIMAMVIIIIIVAITTTGTIE